MNRLEGIRQRCEAAKHDKDAEFDLAIHAPEDMPYLLSEVDRLNKVVPGYAESARVIALYLSQFCDRSLPYAEMIADAARKADAVITVLTAETQKLTARAEKAEQERDAALASWKIYEESGQCEVCKYGECGGCTYPEGGRCKFEWCGPKIVEDKNDEKSD